MYRKRVSKSIDTQISFRYLKFFLLNLQLEVWNFFFKLHWIILVDFDLKMKICYAEIACTNFKYFEGIEKYRSGYRYLGIDTWDWYRKLGIEKYRFLKWVSWSGIEKYRYLNLVSKRGIEKYRYLKKVSIPNTTTQGGGKKSSKKCPRSLWTVPYSCAVADTWGRGGRSPPNPVYLPYLVLLLAPPLCW